MKKNNTYLIAIFLIVASFIAFGRIVGNDFIVTSDDQPYITENNHIQQGINLNSIKWAFTTTYFSYWHPLTWLSHTLDWSLFGVNPSGHHLVSLLLHIGAVIFLFLFLNKTTKAIWPSAFAAALFALHPLRVESVAYAAERKDVLSMVFGMACLYTYAFYSENPKRYLYIICLILFTLSLMSKPMLVTLPFVLLLLDYWPLGRWTKDISSSRSNSTGRLIGEKSPFICLSIFSSIVTIWGQNKLGVVISMKNLPLSERVQNAVASYASYLGKTFWPVDLALFYPYNHTLPLWQILVSCFVLIGVTIVSVYAVKKLPFLFVGWFWYLGTLIPVSGLIQVGELARADRYTYLPSVGIVIMLAWGIQYFIQNKNICENIVFSAIIALLSTTVVLTWQQCAYWKNDVKLWNHALMVTKDNYFAHNNIGIALQAEGRINEALYHYNKAISIAPDIYGYYINRGNAYIRFGQYQQAINDYTKAISLKPDDADGFYDRGSLYGQIGQYNLAIEDLNKTIMMKSDYIKAFNNRGIVYNTIRSYKKALDDFNEAIRLKPDYADAYNNKASIHFNMKNPDLGCEDLRKACELGKCLKLQETEKNGLCH
jgi:tetratricopeptide (TPR) repeat protein